MGCCQSVNWKLIKQKISKTLNLDTTFEDTKIENSVEISNITKTVYDNNIQKNGNLKNENKDVVYNGTKEVEHKNSTDIESSEDDFELV